MRKIAVFLGLFGCMMHASAASAEPSAWLSGGGGYTLEHTDSRGKMDGAGAMSWAAGVGTSPLNPIVVGGTFRLTTNFGLGTDANLSLRVAQGSFVRGQWGLGAEVGPTYRYWRNGDYGTWPIGGTILLGAPWGLQLDVGGQFGKFAGGDPSALGVHAMLEIDFLRLTVFRQGSTDKWWENPSPAGGRMGQ